MKKICLLLLALLALPAQADWRKMKSADFSMAPPPAKNSQEFKEDFAVLLRHQENRSKEDCAFSRTQRFPSFKSLFAKAPLSKEESETVKPLLEKTVKLTERIASYFKGKFARPRPFTTDARITPCVEKPEGNKSYPSSHAAMAVVGACVLQELFPSRARELERYGDYVADLRVVVGVHHPSDVAAGRKLALEVCRRLLSDRDFKRELGELKRAL